MKIFVLSVEYMAPADKVLGNDFTLSGLCIALQERRGSHRLQGLHVSQVCKLEDELWLSCKAVRTGAFCSH